MKKIVVYFSSMKAAGGIERVIANLINLWSINHQIYLLTKDSEDSFYPLNKNIKIATLDLPLILNMNNRTQRIFCVYSNFLKSLKRLHKYLDMVNVDYIYVATPLTALEVCLLGKKYQNKLIISEHSSTFAYNWIYQVIRKIIYPKVYRLSVPTKTDTEIYLKLGYNAVYIPHLATFPILDCKKLKTHTMLNVGRLTSDKQQIKLLQIWGKFIEKNPETDWNLKIVGSGEKNVTLHEYIKDNKLFNVKIYPATKKIDQYYKEASLFLFTSKMEGFGMVLLEAMAYGAVCISFDCPSGPRDIIKDNYNGYLVPCYDECFFCNTMERMAGSPQLLEKLSKNAYSTILSWDNKKIMDSWNELFGENKNET